MNFRSTGSPRRERRDRLAQRRPLPNADAVILIDQRIDGDRQHVSIFEPFDAKRTAPRAPAAVF